MKFKVGDEVTIVKGSRWYGSNSDNPKDIKGVIRIIYKLSRLPYQVDWSNGTYNFYGEKDLELYKESSLGTNGTTPSVSKFKVGDKVRVVKNISDHKFQLGEIVRLVNRLPETLVWITEHLDGSDYWYVTEEEFEHVNENTDTFDWKIRHLRVNDQESKGGAVTILYKEVGKFEYEYKIAICNPKDDFNRKEGVKQALLKPVNKIYNFDVVVSGLLPLIFNYIHNNKLSEGAINTLHEVCVANWVSVD